MFDGDSFPLDAALDQLQRTDDEYESADVEKSSGLMDDDTGCSECGAMSGEEHDPDCSGGGGIDASDDD